LAAALKANILPTMAKTRSKPSTATSSTPKPKAPLKTLDAPISTPPQLVVLPKDASPSARILTIGPSRYFICPEKGFHEFTLISAPKSTPRSWLLAPPNKTDSSPTGYILQTPSLLLATPIDPLFLLLPSLSTSSSTTEFLAPSDHISKLVETSPHLTHILRSGNLEKILESRIEAVCECMDMGGDDNEKMYALSLPKLAEEILGKARRMAMMGPFPRSMEEKFVKSVLDVPVLSVRREESGMSVHDEGKETGAEEEESQNSSNAAATVGDSQKSISTAATSIPEQDSEEENEEIPPLLRLRTSLTFLLKSYIPSPLAEILEPLIAKSVNWDPLTRHIERVDALKKEAQALRSLGENFSRKRGLDEDVEEGRKRKREEEVRNSRRNVSQGVRKLAKVDRSGMRSLASFFGKK
jgi:hypothetical protein